MNQEKIDAVAAALTDAYFAGRERTGKLTTEQVWLIFEDFRQKLSQPPPKRGGKGIGF